MGIQKSLAVGTMAALGLGSPAWAAEGASGEAVYTTVCRQCHGAQFPGSPQLGDAKAWRARLKEGQVRLTLEAWFGVGAMPARGGAKDLDLPTFARAVAYMARAAGGTWSDPDTALEARLVAEAKKWEARRARRGQPH